MTSSRIFKLLVLCSGLAALASLWPWYTAGEPVDRLFLRVAAGILVIALLVGLVGADTRPRLMLRFLAALFALAAVIAYAADVSGAAGTTNVTSGSLLQYMQNFAPVLLAATQRTIEHWGGSTLWDPVLTSILSIPAYVTFLLLALAAGLASRPRHRVQIFINDH